MLRRTPLFALHQELGARLVDFGGWEMPLHYGSQIAEHLAVRAISGIFDVSHMCIVDLKGAGTRALLRALFANDVDKLQTAGRALYGCMLNEAGGVVDDLIVYCLEGRPGDVREETQPQFRAVVNAGTRDKDLAWMRRHAQGFGVEVIERTDLAMLAVQGPEARRQIADLLSEAEAANVLALPAFCGRQVDEWFVSRTGYTGEDGFEIMLPAMGAESLWRWLNARGVVSCGLAARDTLRLEAGMNLYGNDMDETTHPFESGLAWTVAMTPGRNFIGRQALEAIIAAGPQRRLVGLVLEDRGVLRSHQRVLAGGGGGEVTSGTFSPTLERSIALARVPAASDPRVQIDIRGKLHSARIVKPPFVRHGRPLIG